ncbi:hypothetical protein SMACR_04665 [Sordaria macrospora]|uniref:short-chain 2-methylacyl-CoA dehydrogenase n=1 Tax=Sordaria macrospora TaxID=5147 RepID=A0A8S8ZVA9_SORMA|nr:hypothetical protein SMACR_04665 [Sordaria macrospora]
MKSFTRALRPAVRRAQAVTAPRLSRTPVIQCARTLSTTAPRRDITDLPPTPITHFSEVENAMAETVQKFANDVILPKVRDMDEAEVMDPSIVEQLFEQGIMGVEIPEEYGGAGMNFTSAIIGIEELARVDPSVSVMVDVHNTLVNTAVIRWGSEALKKKYLPKLATNTVGSFCLSEPVSGSDAFALATRAVETEHGYKINGSKMWITNSMEADFFIVFANIDPSKGYRGITAFIVEKGMKGFSIAKKEKKLGIRASSTCVLNFDDVEVPKENLLGKVGEGYKYAIGILNEGRIGIGAQMTGLALGAWENAVNTRSPSPTPRSPPPAPSSTTPPVRRRLARTLSWTPPWPSSTLPRSPAAFPVSPSSGWAAWASSVRAWLRSSSVTARSVPSTRVPATSSLTPLPRLSRSSTLLKAVVV